MNANDARRYIVKLEVYAAASPVDLAEEGSADVTGELTRVMQTLSEADPDDIEDQTYRAFRFDVCDDCRRVLLARPLGDGGPTR